MKILNKHLWAISLICFFAMVISIVTLMINLKITHGYKTSVSSQKKQESDWRDLGYDNCVIESAKGKLDVVKILLEKNFDTRESKAFLYDENGNKFRADIDIDADSGLSFNVDQIGYLLTFNYENRACHLKILTDIEMIYDKKGFMSVTNNLDSQGNLRETKTANTEIAKNIEKYNAKTNL